MKTATNLINRANNADNISEINRVYDVFIKKVSDFEQYTGYALEYTLVINPNFIETKNAIELNENIYLSLSNVDTDEFNQLGILKTKLTLFRFDKETISSLLIIVKKQDQGISGLKKPNSKNTDILFDFFDTKAYKLITNINRVRSAANFICLVGSKDSSIELFAECLSGKLSKSLFSISINDILKDNKLLRNALANERNRVIFLSHFDYLFSDLNSSPKIPNRELSMLRHDLADNLALARENGNIILMSVSSPLLLNKELHGSVSFVEYLDKIEYGELLTFVRRVMPEEHNHELLASALMDVPNKIAMDIIKSVIADYSKDTTIPIEKFVLQCVEQYKQTQSEFQKVEGADFKIIDPKVSLDRVVLSPDNKNKLIMALSSIINQNLVYNIWGYSEIDSNIRSIINFYGPPGTGKTMCATAIASELSKQTGDKYKLLALNYSEIESMYVGEAPKKLERVFNYAKDKNLVLFFDEADSFLGKRIQNVSQGSEQAINSLRSTMLIQLEKYTGVVIFATNLTTNYDTAFKTRFLAEIEFPLPDKETCKQIFVKNTPKKLYNYITNNSFSESELEAIATELVGLSGRDIKTVIWRVLLKTSQKDGIKHVFTKDDFISEISIYKQEKETVPNIDKAKITTSVTPASNEIAQRLGLNKNIEKNSQ